MNQAEAILEIEGRFIVHEEVGVELPSYGDDGKRHDTGARDMSVAPNGEPYITVTSSGVRKLTDPHKMWFADEGAAWDWWRYAIMDYAETIAPEAEWGRLHLYWRARPVYECQDYIAVNAARALQTASPMASAMNLTLGSVYSRLLISKLGPDGTEG